MLGDRNEGWCIGDSLGSFLGGPLIGIWMSEVLLECDGFCDGFGTFGDFVLGGGL